MLFSTLWRMSLEGQCGGCHRDRAPSQDTGVMRRRLSTPGQKDGSYCIVRPWPVSEPESRQKQTDQDELDGPGATPEIPFLTILGLCWKSVVFWFIMHFTVHCSTGANRRGAETGKVEALPWPVIFQERSFGTISRGRQWWILIPLSTNTPMLALGSHPSLWSERLHALSACLLPFLTRIMAG